jgi:HD-GYP domain-containing protein (c-di-GMP phosphodiesterase class II)
VRDPVLERATEALREMLRAVRADAPLSISAVEKAAELLLDNLQSSDALLVHLFDPGGPDPDPAREAVNVCLVAVKLGLELGYPREELRHLSLAALLHDVGMVRLPEGLVEKTGPLNPLERSTLARHPEEGAHIITRLGPEYTWLAEVVLQVHERVDGSGYPQVLKEDEIHEFAQVVGLADVYESLVHHRPYRRQLSPVEALKEILHRERAAFPDRILRALVQAMSPYPVGSLVRLNTGEIGLVVAKNKDRPLRPIVEVLFQRGKRLVQPVVIDLSQSPLLHIQDSVVETEEALR